MFDRRQLLLGGLAGMFVPTLAEAQPGGGGGQGGQGGAGPVGGAGGGGIQGNAGTGSRLGDPDQGGQGFRDAPQGNPTAEGEQRPQPPKINALVISQSYRGTPHIALANTTSDAALIARSFQRLRFDYLTRHSDGTAVETMRKIADYLATVDANTIAVVYVAGHGVEIDGENLLLLEGATSFLSLQSVVQLLQQRAGVTVLFVDACRNNPFANVAAAVSGRRIARAVWQERDRMVQIQTVDLGELRGAPAETLGRLRAFSLQGSGIRIIFSTDPANVALEGVRPNSRNSPFAEALARRIREPMSLDDIVALTTGDVIRGTRRMQSPWSQGSIGRPIFLSGRRRRLQAAYDQA